MYKGIISGDMFIRTPGMTPERIEEFKENFNYNNPEYLTMQQGHVPFDPSIPKQVSAANIIHIYDDAIIWSVPRFYRAFEPNFSVQITKDMSTAPQADIPWTGRKLWPHQEFAVTEYMNYTHEAQIKMGILALACGKGKTTTGLFIAHRLGLKTLIIVNQTSLAEQWAENIRALTGIEPAMWSGSGRSYPADISIATIQSLLSDINDKTKPGMVRSYLSNFGLTIFDECHRMPAEQFLRVAREAPSQYVLGLSATPFRSDRNDSLLQGICGPILYTDMTTDLIPSITFVPTTFKYGQAEGFKKWLRNNPDLSQHQREMILKKKRSTFLTAVTKKMERNLMIVQRVLADVSRGHVALVLCNRVEHCYTLQTMFEKIDVRSLVLEGGVSAKNREKIINSVRAKECKVLLATDVAKEGLDIPSLSSLHLTFATASKIYVQQCVGRILRNADDKLAPVVHDYIDMTLAESRRTIWSRIRIYNEQGWYMVNPEITNDVKAADEAEAALYGDNREDPTEGDKTISPMYKSRLKGKI